MQEPDGNRRSARWLRYVIIVLLAEKTIQHVTVTAALCLNWRGIASTVAITPAILIVLGSTAAVLYAVALWAMFKRRAWVVPLVMALALFDIVGEFAAQGTASITLNVSLIVAATLLVTVLIYRRQASG